MNLETIKICEVVVHDRHLEILYSADSFKFSTKVFYHDVSFSLLREKYSEAVIDKVVAHIALFEGMKFCSLFPKYYDVSAIAKGLVEPAIELFAKIYQGVFAQHWYENNVTDYLGPEIIYSQNLLADNSPSSIVGDSSAILAGCGGGKDSIVTVEDMPIGFHFTYLSQTTAA